MPAMATPRTLTLLAVLSPAGVAMAQQRYDFIKIDSFNANPLAGEAFVWDINDAGVAVGVATMDNRIGAPGFVWTPTGGQREIPISTPTGINNAGMVAGIGSVHVLATGVTITLPTLPTTYFAPRMGDVGESGLAVGVISGCSCSDSNGLLNKPYLWDQTIGARLWEGVVPNARGLHRINANDVALGWTGSNSANDAFVVELNSGLWNRVGDLLPEANGVGLVTASDINDLGEIVGQCTNPALNARCGYFYSPLTGTHILPAPGTIGGEQLQATVRASGVNDAGQIVGTMVTMIASERAFVYTLGEGYVNLNDASIVAGIPAGYTLRSAVRISNTGWIAGNGTQGNKNTGWVLRPRVVVPACDSIDFNADGLFPDDADLVDFLSVFAGGACSTGACNDIDFNNDGLFPDDADVAAFLRVMAGGNC